MNNALSLALAVVITFVPKLILFFIILIIGWIIAKLIEKAISKVLCYGLAYSERKSDSGLSAGGAPLQNTGGRKDHAGEPGVQGRDTSGPTTDDAMTRSEERLNVGTEKIESGKLPGGLGG